MTRPSTPPEDAVLGDPCGMLYPIGPDGRSAICDGTLDNYVDVHGPVRGCTCHMGHPPCGACVDAPLACATCHETVP